MDYIRGRAFTSRADFSNLEEAQDWLRQVCIDMNAEKGSTSTTNKAAVIQKEIGSMQPYPGEIGCYELAEYKSDKQSTVCIKTNHYSVPDNIAGDVVIVQIYSEKIVIFDKKHKKVAEHVRSYGTDQWVVDINHYISTLMKKTSAIEYSEPFRQMPMSMQVIYHKFFKQNGKEFLLLVKYVRDNHIAYEDVVRAADLIRYNGVKSFTSDHFKVALHTLQNDDKPFREEQKTDEFIEIETGSEDILSQLENVMENGTKLPK